MEIRQKGGDSFEGSRGANVKDMQSPVSTATGSCGSFYLILTYALEGRKVENVSN